MEGRGSRGWLKASSVSLGVGSSGLTGLGSGREGKGNIVSTSAARGLSSKELVAAKPDFSQVDELQRLAVDSKSAEGFASSGKLVNRSIAMLSAPAKGQERPSSKIKKPSKLEEDDDDE